MKKTNKNVDKYERNAKTTGVYITNAVTDNKTLKDGSVVNRSEENARIARKTSEEIPL